MSQALEVKKSKKLPLAPSDATSAATRRAPRALPEFSRHTPRAGEPDWPTLLTEAKSMAAELRPLLEPPRSMLADAKRRARGIATAAQNFAENRRRAASGREDLLPLYFIWTTHRTCNFLCDYCDDHQGHKYPELPTLGQLDTAQAKRLLEIMRTRTSSIYFAGGEPTLRKDLPELTRYARDLDYYPIIINTNASALHHQLKLPAWRTWMADTDLVIVSLDALDLDLLREMWVYERPQDVLRNVLLLRELAAEMRVKLAVNAVIQPGRIAHARDVLDFACDLGIGFTPVPVNVGPRVSEGLRDDPAYTALSKLVLERKREGHRVTGSFRMNERLLSGAPLACRNTLKPHVDHDGMLFWPCKASINVAPIRLRVLDYPDVDALWAAGRALRDPAGFHGPGPEQCGASCNWAQNYTTDAYAHGLEHPLSFAGEVFDFLRPKAGIAAKVAR